MTAARGNADAKRAVQSRRAPRSRGDDATVVPLFHGTTKRAALSITTHGWQPQDLSAIVQETALRHGVAADALWADLRSAGGVYASQIGRGRWASFAVRLDLAIHSWAQRAPEARREALWGVWRLRNPDRASNWTTHTDGHAFVLSHMSDDDPVVIEVQIPYGELRAQGARSGGFHLSDLVPVEWLTDPHGLVVPEIAIPAPLPPRQEQRLHRVDRHVEWDVFAHLLDLPAEEFIRQAERGKFGPKGTGGEHLPGHRAWWPQRQVERVLRRAGRPVPWAT